MQHTAPRPRHIAKRMIPLAHKLSNGGDTALATAREAQSPLRARHYSSDRIHGNHRPADDDPGYNDQTGTVACSRAQGKGTLYDSFVRALEGLDLSITKVDGVYEDIMGKAKRRQAQRQLREEGRVAGSGHCVACNDWMPGGDEQRIKGGFCPTDAVGWHRAKQRGETRADYIARVRRDKGLDSAV